MKKAYVALDSGNNLVDDGKKRTIVGWKRRALRRMPRDLKRYGFSAVVSICSPEVTGRDFEYVRCAYAKQKAPR